MTIKTVFGELATAYRLGHPTGQVGLVHNL